MKSWPSVHIVRLDTSDSNKTFRQATQVSLEDNYSYPGPLRITTVKTHRADPGGGFLKVIAEWMDVGADIVGSIPAGFMRRKESIRSQVRYMVQNHLVGCYGDVYEVDDDRQVKNWEDFPNFSPDMIGVESIPMETFLFDFGKFHKAGGLNHLLAGSHRPNTFITTMMATVGKIEKFEEVLVERFTDVRPHGYRAAGVLSWDSEQGVEFWRKLQFDKFVISARQFYRTMGWA